MSGSCANVHVSCSKRLVAEWKKSGCPRVCKAAAACHKRCTESYKEGCEEACLAPLEKSCPKKLLGYCTFDPPALSGPSLSEDPMATPTKD